MVYDNRWTKVRMDVRQEIASLKSSTPVYIHVIKFGTPPNKPNFEFLKPDGPYLARSEAELSRTAAEIAGADASKGKLGEPYGETPLYEAMRMAAHEAQARLEAGSVEWASIVIFSDGKDSTRESESAAVQALKSVHSRHPDAFSASIRPYGKEAEKLADELTRQVPFLKLGGAAPPPPPKPARFEFTINESSIALGKVPEAKDITLDLALPADSAKWIDRLEFRLQGVDKPLERVGTKLRVPVPASPDGRLLKLTATSSKDGFVKSINLAVTALKLPPNVKAALKLPDGCPTWTCRAGEPCGLTLAVDASANPTWTIPGLAEPIKGAVLNHAFRPGEHLVKVMAKTDDGRSEATVTVIAIDPTITLEEVAPTGFRFDAGKSITFRIKPDSPGLIPLAGVTREIVWFVNGTEQKQWNERESIEYTPTDAGSLRVEAKCVLSACGTSKLVSSATQSLDVNAVSGIDLVPPPSILRGTEGSVSVLVRVARNVSAVECSFARDGAAQPETVRVPVNAREDNLEMGVPVPSSLLGTSGSIRMVVTALERLADGSERRLAPERTAELNVRDPDPRVAVRASKDRCRYDELMEFYLDLETQDRVAVKSILVTKNAKELARRDVASGAGELAPFPLTPVLKDGRSIELIAQCLDGDGKPIGSPSAPCTIELTAPEPEIVALDGQKSLRWDSIDNPPSPRVQIKVPNILPENIRVNWEVADAGVEPDPRNQSVATIRLRPKPSKDWNIVVKATVTIEGIVTEPKPLTLAVTVGAINPSIDLVDPSSGSRPSEINGPIRLLVDRTSTGPVKLNKLKWRRLSQSPLRSPVGEGSWSIDAQGDVLDLAAAVQVGESLEVTPIFTDLNDRELTGDPIIIPVNPSKGYLWGILLALVVAALMYMAWFIFSGNDLWMATYQWRTHPDSVHQIDDLWGGTIGLFGAARYNLMSKQGTIPLPGDGPSWVVHQSHRKCRFGGNSGDEVELVGQRSDISTSEPRPSYRQPEGSPVSTLTVMAPEGESDHISAEITPSPYEGFIRLLSISLSWLLLSTAWLLISNHFRFI